VILLDAALDEIARGAEIRSIVAARDAVFVVARTPHHGHDEIAGLDVCTSARDRRDLTDGFMSEH